MVFEKPYGAQYNYSPTYELVIDDKREIYIPYELRSRGKLYLYENLIESSFDEDNNEEESLGHNLSMYNMDTSKIKTKMDDVGVSPYKVKNYYEEDPSEEYVAEALCIHCDELINANNIQLHSQY